MHGINPTGSVKAAVLLQKDTVQPERVNKLSENEEETDKQDLEVKGPGGRCCISAAQMFGDIWVFGATWSQKPESWTGQIFKMDPGVREGGAFVINV